MGGLDYVPVLPDIEIAGSRWYAAKIMSIGGLLLAMGIWLTERDASLQSGVVAADWVLLVFGLLSLVAGVLLMIRPPLLRLDQNGFYLQSIWRKRIVRWAQISDFSVLVVQVRLHTSKFVTWTDKSRDAEANPSWHKRRSYDGSLPSGWPIPAEDLRELLQHRLENYRAHHPDAAEFPSPAGRG